MIEFRCDECYRPIKEDRGFRMCISPLATESCHSMDICRSCMYEKILPRLPLSREAIDELSDAEPPD